ncbi:hypothetical protein BDF20DRAFT_816584 [Mycotypha africana]|uniref:uncharacterized protein n=1 Tax=Mycotypha africana TaxID=64632 RepID=UPI0023009794|nr:uncharacterized protein BDF20DRAFT_816584 [Mycotypha africana]KAI8984118.1 hypothetical protein BDF20DRAFT_816584 [Mycotypha africana]
MPGSPVTRSSSPPPPLPSFDPLAKQLVSWTHEQLLERVMQLEKEKELVARQATGTFDALDELIEHVKEVHIGSGKTNYYCGWKDCARQVKPFSKRHKMYNHLRTHTGEKPFICHEADCGKRFSRPDSLVTHSKIHSNERSYLCSFKGCQKAYYHLKSLQKHEKAHQKGSNNNDNCSVALNNNDGNSNEQLYSPPPLPLLSATLPQQLQQHCTISGYQQNYSSTNDELSCNAITMATTAMTASNTNILNSSIPIIQHDHDDAEVRTVWGLLTQAAVFDVMNKEQKYPFI